jgi:hypothetical protein
MTNGRTGNTRREKKERSDKRLKETKECRYTLMLLIFPRILYFGE